MCLSVCAMVKHVSFAVSDDLHERAQTVKYKKDLSWPEYFEAATEELEE